MYFEAIKLGEKDVFFILSLNLYFFLFFIVETEFPIEVYEKGILRTNRILKMVEWNDVLDVELIRKGDLFISISLSENEEILINTGPFALQGCKKEKILNFLQNQIHPKSQSA